MKQLEHQAIWITQKQVHTLFYNKNPYLVKTCSQVFIFEPISEMPFEKDYK
jgi:hypothetical protein